MTETVSGEPHHLPPLVVYGVEERTDPREALENRMAARKVADVLRAERLEVSASMDPVLAFPPDRFEIFNLCEGEPETAFGFASAAGFFERNGYRHTGETSAVLAAAQDKWRLKEFLGQAGIDAPPGVLLKTPGDVRGWTDWPAILKRVDEHGSLHLTPRNVVFSADEAEPVAAELCGAGFRVLLEKFIDGMEISVCLLREKGELKAAGALAKDFSGIGDVRQRILSYEYKWGAAPGARETVLSMPLRPEEIPEELAGAALKAYSAIGGEVYGRVDFRMDARGRGWVIDLNPNCYAGEDGALARCWENGGGNYPDLIWRLLKLIDRGS
ncbi:MAG: hypothetical protein PHV34_06245 [Verrucomicrobiae bacterium]|nr:hypothetical protein [Verrucomicrobiae bacterium]